MPRSPRTICTILAFTLTLVTQAFAASPQQRRLPPRQPRQTKPDRPPMAFRIRLELIEAKITPSEIVDLDLGPKWAKRSLSELLAGLGQIGTARLRYRFDQSVIEGRQAKLAAGGRYPFVRSLRVLEDGRKQSNVEYQEIGCTVTLRAQRLEGVGEQAKERIEVQLDVKVSSLVLDGPIEITEGIKAPIFANSSQSQSLLVKLGETILLTTFDAPEVAPGVVSHGTTRIWRVSVDGLD